MTLKWLEGPEACDTLNPIIEAQGWAPLNSQTCRALIALDDDGYLLRFFVVQLYPLLGPEWAPEQARGDMEAMRAIHEEMRRYMQDARGFMVIAEAEVTDKLCQREGLRKIPYPVYLGPKVQVQ